MRIGAVFFCLLFFPGFLASQIEETVLDTLPVATVSSQKDVTIDRLRAIAPLQTIEAAELNRYDNTTLLAGMNRVPGVRFEERAPGSYRINIRGGSLRAPFGVRNVPVYWNGIPLGEPGGDVPLNFLDASNIDRVEVLRGPTGGDYGPGSSGAVLLRTEQPLAQRGISDVELRSGSFGLFRAQGRYTGALAKNQLLQVRSGYQRTDGHRDHSAFSRLTLQSTLHLRGRPNENDGKTSSTNLHALYTKLDYELPGGLNPEQYAEDPTQARPGSADKNASIHYHNLLLGLNHVAEKDRLSNESTVYATGFYFDHPFNFDYKREANLGAGARTRYRYALSDRWRIGLGGELRLQYRNGQNFENPDASPGALNFSDETYSRLAFGFVEAAYAYAGWTLDLTASTSGLRYAVDRTFSADGNTGLTDFEVRGTVARLRLGRQLNERHSVAISLGEGFSPPTLDEFRTNEGSLNVTLQPERGNNLEINYGYAVNEAFLLQVNAYQYRLRESISSFRDERGTQLFRNAGRTVQNGLEVAADWTIRETFPKVNLFTSYAYTDFSYKEYERDGEDFSGQAIPGVAPHTLNLELGTQLRGGLYAFLMHTYVDEIPLNDANDVFGEAYHLLRLTLGCRTGRFNLFLSGNNLLDERMSFGNDLNPQFGRRFFQPAPGRNWQFGVRFR
ncbi:TonB-dependent receptor [Lewinella sp. W8]|uniref:TonB-dependent receptor n=1 Tax=Lewinella sp. W8 TaxID=2528208 RepID=UPI0010687F87|nr:TonB-dependent receptor plug domain-containing protein [Lewinella sp. W8]MTB50782.1 TonB-dependent receptor plug domain-containing protein [Lewinella sp. W8]